MANTFSNWSGSVRVQPRELAAPTHEAALAKLVAQAERVRVVGAGHSFTPLCASEGTLIDLRNMPGELRAADATSMWAPAGWTLEKLTRALWDRGYALPNQGDINPQTLAGALSTGTHGTGAALGSMATIARAYRLMLADGSVIECSRARHPELFEAQRLSLGLLGVVLEVQIDVLPAYRLEERISLLRFDALCERFDEIAGTHRHAEFFLFPYADHVMLKTLTPTLNERVSRPPSSFDEEVFRFVCDMTALAPPAAPLLQRTLMRLARGSRRFGPAHVIFPSERTVRFEEMEYELPRANGLHALREAVERIRQKRWPCAFPFEFRWTAADDIWLSPFNRGPCASISAHQYTKLPWQALFEELEPLLRAHDGRPHWGKRHTLEARDVHALYPRAADFCRVRAHWDPSAKFANAHLRRLFAIESQSGEVNRAER